MSETNEERLERLRREQDAREALAEGRRLAAQAAADQRRLEREAAEAEAERRRREAE